MAAALVTTTFVITNSQTAYGPDQVWVTFAGSFTPTPGYPQTAGSQPLTSSPWQSFQLSQISAAVSLPYFSNQQPQYTFALNGFSGRIYVNYGPSALTVAPDPGNPGTMPYIVFEPTVAASNSSNMDLSYVDGLSAAAATMIRDATTGAAQAATSVNPVSTPPNMVSTVVGLVPPAAIISNGGQVVRIMSSAASPANYHDWTDLMTSLQTSTATTPLNIASYFSPSAGIPAGLGVGGALYGYSGAPPLAGQLLNFNLQQTYAMSATFTANLNPSSNPTLASLGVPAGTPGVVISGSGSQSGIFSIYITQANLNAGAGVYGNNPAYVVWPSEASQGSAYATIGIWNDLGGRIVGDLMAGMVFGWAASQVNIVANATSSNTNLYGVTFSATTVSGISTGELFFLLSLAGAQGTLANWIGPALDSNSSHYDQYLYAISSQTFAYSSGFTDRLEGYSNPDTYWYTTNPPAIPGDPGHNFPIVGFVNLFLGPLFTVSATQAWQSTGIQVSPTSNISIAYQSGTWTADPQTNGGQLYDANGCPGLPVPASQPLYPLVGANMGALVGRVGNTGPVFLIGDGPTAVPQGQSGELQLVINDDLTGAYGPGLADNIGSVTVQISLPPP